MCAKLKFRFFLFLAISIIIPILVIQFVFLGCDKATSPGDNPRGSLTASSGCLEFFKSTSEPFVPPCCTGFSYEYDSETEKLSITHFGAGFNCCTEPSAEFIFDDTLIIIDENESGEFCDCLCLFDIDYEIENIAPGIYTVRFIEIYTTDEDIPLELTFDLTTSPTGFVQVERSQYPWDDQ